MQRPAPRSQDVAVLGRVTAEFAEILTPEALDFTARLHRQFEPRRQELLARRAPRQKEFDAGAAPEFLSETKKIRESEWRVAPQPKDLLDRRVEITGPTDRKMVINELNCGADSQAPRLAPRREARPCRRQARVGRDLRFRAVLLPQRERADRPRLGTVLLPAEDGVDRKSV